MSALTERIVALTERTSPFLTYYDVATAERTELSGVTTANWVDKTANLILDGLEAEPGDGLRIEAPTHWATLVWILAAWRTGLVVGEPADLTVVGPEARPADAGTTLALSFRPLGLPFAEPPAGVVDFHGEVLSYPDAFFALDEPADTDPACRTPEGVRSHADLADVVPHGRVLATPGGLAHDIDLLAGAIAGADGGLVVVAHGTAADLDRIAASEKL